MKLLILGTVIFLMGAFASSDTGITSKRDPRFFFGLRNALKQDDKNALIRQLRNEISVLRALVTALQPLIARNARRCPTTAVGARRIGDKCYTLTTAATGCLEASRACVNMGGILAEPPLTVAGLADFAADINTVLPGATTAYIGLVNTAVADTVQYLSSGAFLDAPLSAALIDTGTVAATNIFEAVNNGPTSIPDQCAVLPIPAGAPLAFELIDNNARAFICEYNLI